MWDDLVLTPMELFFLGRIMKAKYIDYSYIAAMPDVQKRFAFHEEETLDKLEQKGLVETDFFGNTTIDSETVTILSPVFFGETESVIRKGISRTNVHIGSAGITRVLNENNELSLRSIEEDELEELLPDEECVIECADVKRGVVRLELTREQIRMEQARRQALRIMKGDGYHDE